MCRRGRRGILLAYICLDCNQGWFKQHARAQACHNLESDNLNKWRCGVKMDEHAEANGYKNYSNLYQLQISTSLMNQNPNNDPHYCFGEDEGEN